MSYKIILPFLCSLTLLINACKEDIKTGTVTVNQNSNKNMTTEIKNSLKPGHELATLGGGCFWCTEAVFNDLRGVDYAVSGYAGGAKDNPTYREVCYGNTGHAEVIQIAFDPALLSYEDLLRVFFHVHDPTTLNKQGNDVGTQYRSVIFYHNDAQKNAAEKIIKEISDEKLWDNKIVTEVSPLTKFFIAEDYHQEYFKLNGHAPYCQFVISPKLTKFRKNFKDKLKTVG